MGRCSIRAAFAGSRRCAARRGGTLAAPLGADGEDHGHGAKRCAGGAAAGAGASVGAGAGCRCASCCSAVRSGCRPAPWRTAGARWRPGAARRRFRSAARRTVGAHRRRGELHCGRGRRLEPLARARGGVALAVTRLVQRWRTRPRRPGQCAEHGAAVPALRGERPTDGLGHGRVRPRLRRAAHGLTPSGAGSIRETAYFVDQVWLENKIMV